MQKINQIKYLDKFQCLGDKCPDNCCKGWIINVTPENKKLYEQDNLTITQDLEVHKNGFKMKSCDNGNCIQLKDDLCQLQINYGEKYLPDICYTFPRIYKEVGAEIFMTANLACPATLKIALFSQDQDDFSSWSKITKEREIKNITKAEIDPKKQVKPEDSINIFNQICQMIDQKDHNNDEMLARLLLLADDMKYNDFRWQNINAEIELLSKEEIHKIAAENFQSVNMRDELFHILKCIFEFIDRYNPRYNKVRNLVAQYLGNNNTDEEILIKNYEKIYHHWQESGAKFEPILINFIKANLTYYLFPLDRYFSDKYHFIVILTLQYLTIKLLLMIQNYVSSANFKQDEIIDLIQPITKRFYVKRKEDIYKFCNKKNWQDCNKLVAIVLNFS